MSPETEKVYEAVYIWNTQSGESIRYTKKPEGFEKPTLQLPAKPL